MSKLREALPLGVRKSAKVARARIFEKLGRDTYSWPALNELDRKMAERLPSTGTFLEVGGNDGYSQSNTYYLERHRGWTGVLIEAVPALAERARRTRTRSQVYTLALASPDEAGKPIRFLDMDLMSIPDGMPLDEDHRAARCRGSMNVSTATLSSVLDHAGIGAPTFMSVDVEGAELAALSGLDLERHAPQFLLVETEDVDPVADLLSEHMTMVDKLSFHDYLFERRTTG